MSDRRPLLDIVKEISRRLKLQNYSVRRLETDLKNIGVEINRGKLLRLFYNSEKNNQDFLNNTDDTIEAVLSLLELTNKDIYKSLLGKSLNYDTEFSNFINDPEAKPFLNEAFNKYKANKLEEQVKELQRQIEKLRG